MVCMLTQGNGWILVLLVSTHRLREDRLCRVCHSSKDVEDKQHFLFSCPACVYSDVKQKHASLSQQAFSVSEFFTDCEPNAMPCARGGFVRVFFT